MIENRSVKQLLGGTDDGEIIPDDYNFFNGQTVIGSPARNIISEGVPSKLVSRIEKPTPT